MIHIKNNCLGVFKEDVPSLLAVDPLIMYDIDENKNLVVRKLYTELPTGDILIPYGFNQFIDPSYPRVNEEKKIIPTEFEVDWDKIAHSFGDIVLREDQIIAIRKAVYLRRGIIQASTGSGKTNMIIGTLMAIRDICGGELPNTIILAPTAIVVSTITKCLKAAGFKVNNYKANRGIVEGLIVSHPSALNNDLDKNPHLLDSLKIFISDEGHHCSAVTWRRISLSAFNIEYSLAFSASIIDEDKVPIRSKENLTYEELLVVGATGGVIFNANTAFYIKKGVLATPILYRLDNAAQEKITKNNNWHEIRKYRLESHTRLMTIAKVASYTSTLGYKVLILIETKNSASTVLKYVHSIGLGDVSRCSFGGGVFLKYNEEDNTLINPSAEDSMQEYEDGKLKILIGTSHIYEGADVPNLDVVILASVGKKSRRCIQGVGRGLRRTKTGKYAHIIDFTDYGDYVLSMHSNIRLETFKKIIGVEPSNIYEFLSFQGFKEIFYKVEELGGADKAH